MNHLETELRKMIGYSKTMKNPVFIENDCVVKLPDQLTAKLSLFGKIGYYSKLQIALISRHQGQIDMQSLSFVSVFPELSGPNQILGIRPDASDSGVWYSSDKAHKWVSVELTEECYQRLAAKIDDYLLCFLEPEIEQNEEEQMDISI